MVLSFKKMNAEAYLPDIDNEKPDNYRYDKIGNLIRDRAEGIDTIKWTVYGKIHQIVKATGDVITYGYDAGGNRTSKQVIYTDTTVSTYYLRDAQGNVLAVYGHTSYNNEVKWKEQHLYGSSRLGMWRSDTVVSSAPPVVQNSGTLYDSLLYGARSYELTNHLGNVMVTISDKKVGVDSADDGTVAYYTADVRTAQDYYPFGMLMPGRMTYEGDYRWVPVDPSQIPEDVPVDLVLDQPRVSGDPAEYKATNSITMQPEFSSMTGDEFLAHIVEDDGLDPDDYSTASRYSGVHNEYRYGYSELENADELKGTGNSYVTEHRIYDPRLGKWFSADALAYIGAGLTPYQNSFNNPIAYNDPSGLWPWDPKNVRKAKSYAEKTGGEFEKWKKNGKWYAKVTNPAGESGISVRVFKPASVINNAFVSASATLLSNKQTYSTLQDLLKGTGVRLAEGQLSKYRFLGPAATVLSMPFTLSGDNPSRKERMAIADKTMNSYLENGDIVGLQDYVNDWTVSLETNSIE